MWKLSVTLGLTIILVLAVVLGVRHIKAQTPTRPVVPPVPFTAQLSEEKYRYPSGQYVTTLQQTVSVRSDGTYSTELFQNGAQLGRLTIDMSTHNSIALDYPTLSVTTTYSLHWPPIASCANVPADAPVGVLLGYQVRLVKEAVGNPRLSMRMEKWVAPALNCFALKSTRYRGRSGLPEVIVSQVTVTEVIPGEPAGSAFSVPPNYTERSPAAVYAESNRLHPEAPVTPEPRTVEMLEKSYRAGQEENVKKLQH